VDSLSISRFKATCLAELERVRRTGRPLIITKRGVPIAQVLPAPHAPVTGSRFGALAGSVTEHADLLAPLDEAEWEALR
jgi:prevent-host-death family protein